MKLSVVIPSYKDPLLLKTIQSLLETSRLGNDLEIIAVLDGYTQDVAQDPRVRVVELGKNVGMRGAINAGVRIAKGEFIMRTDEHCMFGECFDKIMTDSCQPNWILTARRYFLDPIKWEAMDIPPVDREKLVIQGGVKFSGLRWPTEETEPIIESMAMQGSMWVMPHKWWNDVIGELQTEGYGPLYQDSHEMVFKTWKAGGKLMVNRNTWFAHKHRSFSRTHDDGTQENPSNKAEGWKYTLDTWGEYYKEIKDLWKI